MTTTWKKKGQLFTSARHLGGATSHTQMPIVDFITENRVRVYYSTRDQKNRTLPAWFETDLNNPSEILSVSEKPVLELGAPGTFDDCGVMPSWIVDHANKKYLYYIGWNVPTTAPFHNCIGLAVSNDGGRNFEKAYKGPVLDRNIHDPLYVATPCVLIHEGKWKMWYLSGTHWVSEPTKMRSFYNIRHAESDDGIHWRTSDTVCIDYILPDECAIARPFVRIENGIYRMWYCYRWDFYRIGYAESTDGVRWNRKDHLAGLAPSEQGWDSEMVAYPCIVKWKGNDYLFYNGNGFGQTGIGYAINES